MPGFDNQVVYARNVDFSNGYPVTGQITQDGQLLIGSTAFPNIVAGYITSLDSSITVTNGSGTIDLSVASAPITFDADSGSAVPSAGIININGAGGAVTSASGNTITITAGGGSGMTWNAIGADQTLAVNNGYFCTSGAVLSLALPAVSALGDTIEISLDGSTGFTITQSAGQTIKFGNQITSAGAGGSITSTGQGDTIRMVCKTANLSWNILSAMGNLTFV